MPLNKRMKRCSAGLDNEALLIELAQNLADDLAHLVYRMLEKLNNCILINAESVRRQNACIYSCSSSYGLQHRP